MNPTRNAITNNTKIAAVIHFSTRFNKFMTHPLLSLPEILFLVHPGVIPSCLVHPWQLRRFLFDPEVRVVSSSKVDQMQTTPLLFCRRRSARWLSRTFPLSSRWQAIRYLHQC